MESVSVFAPAKLNLFLAITGRRADGFHDLVSVVVRTEFGDELTGEVRSGASELQVSLSSDDPTLAVDGTNLVVKAAEAFARRSGWRGAVAFQLAKRIPMGAGLGGGSSDGVAALRVLDRATGGTHTAVLPEVAAQLGSDCPLFLRDGPVVMRGRGERVEALPEAAARRLRGRRVLIFKPAFGIPTPWAYGQLAAAAPASYLPAEEAERRLAAWIADDAAPAEALLFNTMEAPAFRKFVALPTLLDALRGEFGLSPRMSGSGSACFTLLEDKTDTTSVVRRIREAWGESAFVAETRLL